jgi:Uma2 family endonuclease
MVSSDAGRSEKSKSEKFMSGAVAAPLSIDAFRAWLESRPGEEHWELIAGVPTMMAPATRDHQRIASNLEWLLNGVLETRRPDLAAYQRVGLNLAPVAPDYDPEPDVVVVDADASGDARYSDRFYLAAEVVSRSDRKTVESKRDIYKRHPDCRYVLVIEQKTFGVSVSSLSDGRWTELRLTAPADVLILDDFGLRCTVADLYRGTALLPRK